MALIYFYYRIKYHLLVFVLFASILGVLRLHQKGDTIRQTTKRQMPLISRKIWGTYFHQK